MAAQLRSVRYRGHGWGADSLVARYGYDVLGRRIARRVYWSPLPGAEARETRYLYQGGQVVAETDAAGAFKWKYTWGPGTDNLVGLQDSTGTQFYVVQDQLGSVRGLVRRDGTWIMSQRFTPAGQLLARDSVGGHQWPKGLHVGWTGRETDPETGLSFHRARYYSPELRRWTQEDPIGYGGGGNLYAYVGGAVLEGRDPSGLFAEVGDLGLGFAVQEAFGGGGDLSMCLVFCTDARDREEQKWEEWFEEAANRKVVIVRYADGHTQQITNFKFVDAQSLADVTQCIKTSTTCAAEALFLARRDHIDIVFNTDLPGNAGSQWGDNPGGTTTLAFVPKVRRYAIRVILDPTLLAAASVSRGYNVTMNHVVRHELAHAIGTNEIAVNGSCDEACARSAEMSP
ncbi:MAG: RHS repeat-associated core domain-containing protein [Gemmatimonadetes bacterium]|nr:RHS repeat-associated core domain-containing protein [Gemmatimonadota bacterium]